MAALQPDQLEIDADGATARPPGTRVIPEPGDGNVRSARLLDAGRYPVITFRSEGMNGLALEGALTVRNVTMPVSVSIGQSAVTPRSFNAHASTRIDRNEFGVTAYRGRAARYLDISVGVRCVRS